MTDEPKKLETLRKKYEDAAYWSGEYGGDVDYTRENDAAHDAYINAIRAPLVDLLKYLADVAEQNEIECEACGTNGCVECEFDGYVLMATMTKSKLASIRAAIVGGGE